MLEKSIYQSVFLVGVAGRTLLVFVVTLLSFVTTVFAQQPEENRPPIIVQPGAPGETTKVLSSATNAKLPPVTKADVEFMQGMIHHHAQAVEMVALMKDRSTDEKLLSFGARISQTQAEEIKFMERWLQMRGQKTTMEMSMTPRMKMPKTGSMKMDKMKMSEHKDHKMGEKKMAMKEHQDHMMMPGMLTPKQMKELAAAKGTDFDRLFLSGMIQHHDGALVMVDDLFKSPGAGQDAEIFAFATDVDGTQRTEIKLMKEMLKKKP